MYIVSVPRYTNAQDTTSPRENKWALAGVLIDSCRERCGEETSSSYCVWFYTTCNLTIYTNTKFIAHLECDTCTTTKCTTSGVVREEIRDYATAHPGTDY